LGFNYFSWSPKDYWDLRISSRERKTSLGGFRRKLPKELWILNLELGRLTKELFWELGTPFLPQEGALGLTRDLVQGICVEHFWVPLKKGD